MKNIFKNIKLNKKFHEEGYVIVPLLDEKSINGIVGFYNETALETDSGFHSTHFFKDRNYKKNVHEFLKASIATQIETLLEAYNYTFGNFMVKEIGVNSIMPLHADWTYVNENESISLGVWCPLIDTNKINGMLGVIPKSHLFKTDFRGPKIPSLFDEFNEYLIENYGKEFPMKKGEILIYNHKLLHFSKANLSNEKRIAINLVFTPKSTSLFHHANIEGTIRKYEVIDSNFYINYDHFETPDSETKWSEVKPNKISITKKTIDELLSKKSFFSFLFKKSS